MSEMRWLDEIERRAEAATPGPWYVENPDDAYCMNVIAVTTGPVHDIWDLHQWEYADRVVALTLLQTPLYACLKDDSRDDPWWRNAEFIAHAREDVPKLCRAVRELAWELESILRLVAKLDEFGDYADRVERAYEVLEKVARGDV